MLGIIFLVLGVIYLVRRPKIAQLQGYQFPQVPLEEFERWRRYELRSIDVFLVATFGSFVLSFVTVFMGTFLTAMLGGQPGTDSLALMLGLPCTVFLVGLIVSAVYGSQGAKLRKIYGLRLP